LSLHLFIHRAQYGGNIRLPRAVFDYQHLAQPAEAALFDSIFVADQLALGGHEFFRRCALGWSRSLF